MNDIEILENMVQQYKSANFPKAQLLKKIEERIYKHEIIAIENLIQRNKDLEQIEKEHKEENGRLRDKIKELEEIDLTTVYMDGIYDERDKWIINIKEKIKKYNKQRETTDDKEIYYRLVDYIDILQELLEESEK